MSMKTIAQRAKAIKADPKLRHVPNESDLRVAREHAKIMAQPQLDSINSERKSKNELQTR